MLELKPTQVGELIAKANGASKALKTKLDRLKEAIDGKPGQVATRLGWDAADIMYLDLARREYECLVQMAHNKECNATLDSLMEWYTNQLIVWRPVRSSSPSNDLAEEERHRVHQNVLTTLTNFKESQ